MGKVLDTLFIVGGLLIVCGAWFYDRSTLTGFGVALGGAFIMMCCTILQSRRLRRRDRG